MAMQVPFGQFLPGRTVIHRSDARVKIIVAIAYTIALFASSTWLAQGILCVLMLLGYRFAHVPFRIALRGIKPLLYIIIFTVIVNAFTFTATTGVIPLVGSFAFKPAGFLSGLYFALRISLLVLATSLVTFTTSALALSDALTSLMRPLRVFHVPVDDLATMFSIALRFIPTTAEEAEEIRTAQRARGVRFDEGNLAARVKAWVPVLVPLFVGLFRRADELACAMEARCYTGVGRTRLNVAVMTGWDWVAMIGLSAGLIAMGVLL